MTVPIEAISGANERPMTPTSATLTPPILSTHSPVMVTASRMLRPTRFQLTTGNQPTNSPTFSVICVASHARLAAIQFEN